MDIKNILSDFQLSENKIMFRGINYTYLTASYYYKSNLFSRYYILNCMNDEEYRLNNMNMNLNDKSFFEDFQKELVGRDFFHCIGDTRFNLYLIFIINTNNELDISTEITNNFRYARKVILSEDEFKDYFLRTFILQRNGKTMQRDIQKMDRTEMLNYLYEGKEIVKDLIRDELEKDLSSKRFHDIYFNQTFLDVTKAYIYLNESVTKKTETKKENTSFVNLNESILSDFPVQSINSLSVKNYRRFKKECNMNFAKVNLLYGENGTGKTSILDALEFGITGWNRKADKNEPSNGTIEVTFKSREGTKTVIQPKHDIYKLSEFWYGIRVENNEEFNKLFNRFNYFDTSWASAFAIEGREQVNIKQLQTFLGIEDISRAEKALVKCFESLLALDKYQTEKRKLNYLSTKTNSKKSQHIIDECNRYLKDLKENSKNDTLSNILKIHIHMIESIFNLLACNNEYSGLRIEEQEIVAVRHDGSSVAMSKMSTGQKVCLALSFMFALFLSNEKAPNIIMLDEPVANLDDLHMLNLLDVLRRLALSGTQIFFTTANPDVALLFRRKFSFMNNEFKEFRVSESEKDIKICYNIYSPSQEKALIEKNIY